MGFPKSLRDLVACAESLVDVEDMSGKRGFLQSINPLAKLVAIIFMISSSLFISSLPYLSLLCLISLVLALLSKIPLRNFVLRTTFFIPVFAAVISLPVLFLTRGHPIFSADISALTLSITSEGLQRFLVFTVRVWFCVASLTLLILSTGFDGMLKLLASLRVPCLVVQLFSLTYRYFFVSIHEVQRVLIAREARTYVNRSTMNFEGLKNLGTILATLFIRTYERSERVYMAMKSRGFEIGNSHKSSLPSLHLRDVLFAVSTIIALSLLAVS